MTVTTVDNWEYARWVYIIGRSLRYNLPTGAERTSAINFMAGEIITYRPWLLATYYNKIEPTGVTNTDEVIGRFIAIIGRNMNKIQLVSNAEKTLVDNLITATGNRRYGNLGGPAGSDVVR